MLLSKILESINVIDIINFKDFEITDIEYDSRQVKDGFLFFANKGKSYVENNFSPDDGHNYLIDAYNNGASVFVVNKEFIDNNDNLEKYKQTYDFVKEKNLTLIVVKDTVIELSKAAAFFFNYPSRSLNVIGITGTNGKTSTTFILEHILKAANKKCGVVGSISYRYNDKVINNIEYTTPKSLYYQRIMHTMLNEKVAYFISEVSSHGIDMNRVSNIDFDLVIFTNLSRDHLEYHENMDNYFNVKKRLFTEFLLNSTKKNKFALINTDCEYGKKLFEILKLSKEVKIITYGFNTKADVFVSEYSLKGIGSVFTVVFKDFKKEFKINLVGKHNIYNTLVSIIACNYIYKIDLDTIFNALNSLNSIVGRLEPVINDYNIFVDFAHTDDALKNVLLSLKTSFPDKKIISVFGCGGNRDKGKRPSMGRVVSDLSDYTYITSDNPRFEDPLKIIESISAGVKKGTYEIIVDRKEALEKAVNNFNNNTDVLLIAGKGHETYQEINGRKYYFNDRDILKDIIRKKFIK